MKKNGLQTLRYKYYATFNCWISEVFMSLTKTSFDLKEAVKQISLFCSSLTSGSHIFEKIEVSLDFGTKSFNLYSFCQ